MTFEHKIIVGLEEIKAIIFRCTSCTASISVQPDGTPTIPTNCPNGHQWQCERGTNTQDGAVGRFIRSLEELRKPIYEKQGFKIFLEFEEPKQ